MAESEKAAFPPRPHYGELTPEEKKRLVIERLEKIGGLLDEVAGDPDTIQRLKDNVTDLADDVDRWF